MAIVVGWRDYIRSNQPGQGEKVEVAARFSLPCEERGCGMPGLLPDDQEEKQQQRGPGRNPCSDKLLLHSGAVEMEAAPPPITKPTVLSYWPHLCALFSNRCFK